MTWAVGWHNGDDNVFLAFGDDPERLPVYAVTGTVREPEGLTAKDLLFPSCLRMMPDADPVLDLQEITDGRAAELEALIVTDARLRGET